MQRIFWLPAGLLMLAWLSPLHVLPWLSWQSEVLAVLALLVGCASALYVTRRGQPPDLLVPSLALLPTLLVVAALLQWLEGRVVFAGTVFTVASYGFIAAAAAAAGHAAGRSDQSAAALSGLAWALVAASLVQWVVAFSQVFSLWNESGWIARITYAYRSGGNFAQPNQAALLFVMGMASAVYLLHEHRIGKTVAAVLLLFLATGLATTQSRSGLLAIWVLAAGLVLRRNELGGRAAAATALAYALLAGALFHAWPGIAGAFWMQPPEEVNLTSSGRIVMWMQFLQAVRIRPWFGWGVSQVAEAQNAIADRFAEVMPATYSHDVFLDLALWAGLPVLLACICLVAAWGLRRRHAVHGHAACYCLGLVLPFATQALTEFPYSYAYFIVPVFFALGVFDAHSGHRAGLRLTRTQAVGILAAAAALYGWAGIEYVQIEEDFRVARFEALRVGATPSQYETPKVHLLTQLDALLRATRIRPRPKMPAAEIELLRRVAMAYPWGFPNFNYAMALALNGQIDEARRQLAVYRATQGEASYERIRGVIAEMAREQPLLRELRLSR